MYIRSLGARLGSRESERPRRTSALLLVSWLGFGFFESLRPCTSWPHISGKLYSLVHSQVLETQVTRNVSRNSIHLRCLHVRLGRTQDSAPVTNPWCRRRSHHIKRRELQDIARNTPLGMRSDGRRAAPSGSIRKVAERAAALQGDACDGSPLFAARVHVIRLSRLRLEMATIRKPSFRAENLGSSSPVGCPLQGAVA